MESLDLDINNYDLTDILSLFKVSHNLTEKDMKKAKKTVLMTHPDKSRLSPDIFLFYSKAYKILYYVYQFRKKHDNYGEADYNPDIEEIKKSINEEERIKTFTKSNEFNKNFNKIFNENRMQDEDTDSGYKDWLTSDDNLNTNSAKNMSQMNSIIDKKKKDIRDLVEHRDFEPIESGSNYDLTRDKPTYYSSDIFSKLPYEDLRRAHIETVVPVSEEDLHNTKTYSNVIQLKNARNSQNVNPMNNTEVAQFLKQQEDKNIKLSSNIAFRLAKQSEESKILNQNISKHFNRILN